MIDQDTYYDLKREAEEEALREEYGFERTLVCSGCEDALVVLYDERTDEPWWDLEPCEVCGTKDWLDA